MPPSSILLGTGRLPGELAKGETLEVHLHLDYPATPISLGVRWGTQSTGAGFTLQQATAYREEEHLRACGCDWLRQVASEERLSGRVFTPSEILQRRPIGAASPPPLETAPARREVPDGTLEKIRKALLEEDFEEIEGLRDLLNDTLVLQIAADWRPDLPRETKDAYAALLLDQFADCVHPIFRDALNSPSVESRAYAVCVLTKDFSRFNEMLVDGGLDEERVDAAIRSLEKTGINA
jgi:hypothetical protein